MGETFVIQGEEKKEIGAFIADISNGVKEVEEQLDDLSKKNDLKYWLHVYGFTFGLLFLMVSRGYEPAMRLICFLFK